MARVPYVSPGDLAEPAAGVLAGYDVNLFRALANAPEGMVHLHALGMWIRSGLSLPARLRELAILQVGACSRSTYEFSHHVGIGLEHGLSPADVEAVLDPGRRSGLAEIDRAVLDAATGLAEDGELAEPTWATLRRHLDDQALTELVVTVSFYTAVVRMLAGLQVDLELEHEAALARFPFPA